MTAARQSNIVAIILAAGQGKRIGGAKALLPLDNSTFLERILSNLKVAGLLNPLVVVSPQIVEQVKELLPGIDIVVNKTPNADMWSSLQIGLSRVEQADGCMIIPVDHPFVRPETLGELADEFRKQKMKVVIPTFNNRSGHPIIIPFDWAKQLPEMAVQGGLRTAIRESGLEIVRVKTNDPGILRNINESKDLESP